MASKHTQACIPPPPAHLLLHQSSPPPPPSPAAATPPPLGLTCCCIKVLHQGQDVLQALDLLVILLLGGGCSRWHSPCGAHRGGQGMMQAYYACVLGSPSAEPTSGE